MQSLVRLFKIPLPFIYDFFLSIFFMAKKGPVKYVIFFYKEPAQNPGEKEKTIICGESIMNTRTTDPKEKKIKRFCKRANKHVLCSTKVRDK